MTAAETRTAERPSEHTPAPWRLCLGRNGSFSVEDNNRIAILCSRAEWTHRAQESEANARLIAAAPDMLEALKKIAEGRGRFSTDQLTFASNTIDDMKELANAAIAKATGA